MDSDKVVPFKRITWGGDDILARSGGSGEAGQLGVLIEIPDFSLVARSEDAPLVDPRELEPMDTNHIGPRLNAARIDVAAKRDEASGKTFVRVQVTEPDITFIFDLTPKQAEKVARSMIVMAQLAREDRAK